MDHKSTVLALGESKTLPIAPHLPVFVQTKGIVSIKDRGSQLRITAKKRGQTKLRAGTQKYNITVLGKKDYNSWKHLKAWVQNRRGLEVKVANGKVSLEGQFLTSLDFFELSALGDISFRNRARFPHRVVEPAKNFMNKVLRSANLEASSISFQPYLSVSLSKEQKKKRKEFSTALSPFGAKIEIQESSLSINPIIKVRVLIARVGKSFFRHWGLEWPSSVQAQVLDKGIGFSPIPFTAHTLEQQGWGKVLASPTLISQSGKKAHFHSGGEFPIKNFNQFSQNVSWKKYGIFLEILPQADLNKHLRIKIKNEISMLDHSKAVDGVPSLIKDEFQSVFNLRYPKPILLSGLFRKEWGESRQGLPLLAQIPIFRHLFSSEAESDTETELVFIVHPEIVEP